jgi:hypothetical protein
VGKKAETTSQVAGHHRMPIPLTKRDGVDEHLLDVTQLSTIIQVFLQFPESRILRT